MMATQHNLTDRAFRYRATAQQPVGPKVCAYCGSKKHVEVEHIDGHEENTKPENLVWACRQCNTVKGRSMQRAGMGRKTHQFNAARSDGAVNLAQWLHAVGCIIPHKYPERNYGLRAGCNMTVPEAVAMIRATPASKRAEFGAALSRRGRRNPAGAFQRCVDAVSAAGSAVDPRAVCAAQGRRLYGQREMTRRSIAGKCAAGRARQKKNIWPFSSKLSPRQTTAAHGGVAAHAPRGATEAKRRGKTREEQAAPRLSAVDTKALQAHYARGGSLAEFLAVANPAQRRRVENVALALGTPSVLDLLQREHGVIQRKLRGNPSDKPVFVYPSERFKGHWTVGVPGFPVETRKSKRGAISWADRIVKAGHAKEVIVRENPADAAAEMSERFHGRPVKEVLEVDEDVFYHSNLAELGELERLKVKAVDRGIVTLTGFDGALLCSNEEGTQLYIRDGDQSVDPATFAVQKPYHDSEDLGEVVKIWYFTTKKHLGKEGGTASYHHSFGEEDSGKKRRPRLVYSVQDQLLSLVGGAYKIEPEGIRN